MENTPIKRSDLQVYGTNYLVFGAVVPKQMTEEELIDPGFWVNVAAKLMVGCEIRVIDTACSFMARLFVTYVNQHDIRVSMLEHHVFEDVGEVSDGEHFIKLRGTHRWCVMKKGNPEPIQKDIASKPEAERQLSEYLKTLAR